MRYFEWASLNFQVRSIMNVRRVGSLHAGIGPELFTSF